MRRTLIIMLAVLATSLAVCGTALGFLNDTVGRAEELRAQSLLAAEQDDAARATEKLAQLAAFWEDRKTVLEMIVSHDDVHDVKTALAEAKICLECGDHDDFLRNMAVAGEGLAHIRDEETISLENLY